MRTRRALVWTAAAALCLLAAALCAMHLRPTHNTEALALAAPKDAACAVQTVARPTGAVNVNTADAQALDALPGVGEAIARRIVENRETYGAFFYPEDLLSVSGIGTKTLQKLWDSICLE